MSDALAEVSYVELKVLKRVARTYHKSWLAILGFRPASYTEKSHYHHVRLSIRFVGSQYCLCSKVNDNELTVNSWHPSVSQAKNAAAAHDGWDVQDDEWHDID